MWSSFRGKYPCTTDLISYSIAIIAGVFIWAIFSSSEYALLIGLFGGGAILCVLRGEEIIIWPKSVEQKVKEEKAFCDEAKLERERKKRSSTI